MTIKTFTLNTNSGLKKKYISVPGTSTTNIMLECSFDIPNFSVENGAKLRITNISHEGGVHQCLIYVRDISFNSSLYYTSDGSYPLLFSGNLGDNQPQIYLKNTLTLNKQSINYINFVFSDSLTNINAGITNATISTTSPYSETAHIRNLIITLEIEEEDLKNA
jgi:hypothetical protein